MNFIQRLRRVGKRRKISGDTSSAESFQQVRSWLDICIKNHPKCHTDSQNGFLPTRLIDLGLLEAQTEPRLINSKGLSSEGLQYIVLSHGWGGQLMALATTTAATVQARSISIPLSTLPPIFVHAAEVVRKLNIRYLWIDALCIIQNSHEDWNREASLMSQVYNNSYCTIAALVSQSSSDGLYRSNKQSSDSVEFTCSSSTGKPHRILAVTRQDSWQTMYQNSTLNKLGWGLQERELSPRILHYGASQVIWECRTMKATEGWPTENMPEEHPKSSTRILDSIKGLDKHSIYNLWHQAVTDYTSRKLTREEDTLPALAGLARIVSKYIDGEYFAGLWASDLRRGLGWSSEMGIGWGPLSPLAIADILSTLLPHGHGHPCLDPRVSQRSIGTL